MNGDHCGDSEPALRLRPEMASSRLLVLQFVRSYILRMGGSPSFGEIRHATGLHRLTIMRAVKKLVQQGLLLRHRRERGLALPDDPGSGDPLNMLAKLGWQVDAESGILLPPGVSKANLMPVCELDYLPRNGESGSSC